MDNWKNSDYRKIKLISASNFKVPLFNKPALLQQFNCPIYLLSLCIIILEIDTTKLMGPLYHIISAQLYGLDWMTGFSATESINARKFRKKKRVGDGAGERDFATNCIKQNQKKTLLQIWQLSIELYQHRYYYPPICWDSIK